MAKQMNFSVGIKTTYDAAGVNKLKADLTALQNIKPNSYLAANTQYIETSVKAANALKTALTQAYNPKLGTSTVARFNDSLKKSGITIKEVQAGLHNFGVQGDTAFLNATTNLLKMNTVARSTNTVLDKMFVTLKNTITWGMSSALWNNITGSIQKTYYYVKDLDTALNDIRIVTGKSNDEMAAFAKNANEAAKALGTTTKNYAEGALIYYQQGLSDEEVKVRNDITAKTAMVTGQSMDQVSEQLTAVWNGYKASADEAELYVDRLAAVAATTASDLEELSTGMSKVASSAANLGVTESQLSAILATTISVTRQAPESVGTAYKTIFARISDIKAGLDTETTFGNYTSKMAAMGISVLDTTGNLRDMGEVIEEIGSKWANMTREQQISLAQTMAGTRQYNNLVALFDNWGNYVETLNTAENAMGTLSRQHNIALDSINNRLNILKATWESLYQNLIDADDIKDIISAITVLADKISFLVESVGGLKTILPAVTGFFLQIGSNRIAKEIGVYVNDFMRLNQEVKTLEENAALFNQVKAGLNITDENNMSVAQASALEDISKYYEKIIQYQSVMTDQDKESYNMILKQKQEIGAIAIEIEKIKQNSNFALNGEMGRVFGENREGYRLLSGDIGKTFNFSDAVKNDDIAVLNEATEKMKALNYNLNELNANIKKAENSSQEAEEQVKTMFSTLEPEFGFTQEQVKALENTFDNLATKNKGDYSVAFEKLKTSIGEAINVTGSFSNGLVTLANAEEQVKTNSEGLFQKLDMTKVIADITNLTGLMASFGMALNQVKTLWDTWNNEDLTLFEKVTRTLTAVGFLLPTIIKSVSTVVDFSKRITEGLIYQKALKESTLTTDQRATLEAEKKLLIEKKETAELEKQRLIKKQADDENNVSRLMRQNTKKSKRKAQDLRNTINKANYAGRIDEKNIEINELNGQLQKVDNQLNGPQGNAPTGLAGLITASPQAAAAIGIVVVALAALVGGLALAEEIQKRETKRRLESLKTLKEETEKREEEVQKTNEVVKNYKELQNQFNENKITEIEFRNQTVALTKDLEDQSLKLKMLTGDYKNLNEAIEEVAYNQNASLIADYEKQQNKAQSTMQAAFVQGTTFGQDLWKTLIGGGGIESYIPLYGVAGSVGSFIKGMGKDNQVISKSFDPTANSEFKKYVSQNSDISKFLDTRGPGGYKLHIEDEDIVEAYEAIDKAIQDNAHLANTETLKELTTIRDNMQEAYDIQKEATQKRNELLKENLATDFLKKADTITNAEQYAQMISEMATVAMSDKYEIFKEDEVVKARAWANSVLMGISEEAMEWSKSEAYADSILNAFIKDSDISDEVLGELFYLDENEANKLAKEMSETFSDAEMRMLLPVAYSVGAATGETTAEGIMKGFEDYLKEEGNQRALAAIQVAIDKKKLDSALALANEKGGFNSDAIQKLIKDIDFSDEYLKNAEDFNSMNFGDQMLTGIWTSANMSLTEEQVNEIIAPLENQKEQISGRISEIIEETKQEAYEQSVNLNWQQALYDDEGNLIYKDGEQQFETVDNYKDQIEGLINAYSEGGDTVENFTEAQKELYDSLVEKGLIDAEQFESLKTQNAEYDKLQEELSNIVEEISNYQAEQRDWNKVVTDATKVSELYSNLLDEVQSSYKTLSAAEKEWNLNEGFSIDTLQNLLKMNPAYLDALEDQEGQFKINTERLNEVARAEANVAVNEWEMAQAAKFNEVAEKGKESQYYNSIIALDILAAETRDLTSAIWEQVQANIANSDALSAAEKATLSMAAAQQQAAGAKYRKIANEVDVTKDTKKSGKSKSKDEKNYRDEFDRYWEYLKAIEKVQDAIDELNKKEKNLYGKEKISLLKNKNELLNQQVGTYNDLYEEQKREQSELIAKLTQQGVTFNGTGEITNYAQRTSQALAEYNEAVRKYNAGMLSDTAFELAEKSFEDFKKSIDRYDKLYYTEMKDTLDKIEDINREVLANNLEAWEIDIKLNIDWEALQREWTDFLHNMDKDFTLVYEDLGDELTRIMKKATTYTEGSGTLETDLKAIYDVMSEIDKLESGEQSTMFESISQAQEKLKSLNSDLMKDTEGLHKLWEEAYKAYLEGIDQLNEKFEEQMGYYERIDKELQHQQNLIGLLYGDEAYDMMDTLYRNQEKNQIAEIDSLRRQRDLWKEQWEAAEEGSQEQLKYYELMVEAQDNLNDGVEKYIELLKKDATNAIDNILNNYDKWLTNGQGLKIIKADWDDMSKYIDKYFDSIESTYHIETLASKIRQGIDKQDSVNAQKKLQDLYDKEIKYLKEKEELTEYDIKAAEIRYNIALKEIALQEAQEAKNSMKVTRDTNGNWTYQYVADLGDEEEKRQQLSDEIYKLYELANDAYNDNLTNMITLQEEYSTRMRELALEEINTGRDMTAEKDKLNQWYFENYERLAGENLIYQQDMADAGAGVLKDAYDNNVFELEDYTETQKELIKKMTEANIQDFQNLSDCVRDNVNGIGENTKAMLEETVPEWTSSAKEIADAWNADDGQSIKAQVINATQDILDATRDYQDGLDELQITAQVDFDEIINTIEDTTDATEDLKDMVEELCNDNDLDDYKDAIDNIKDAWNGVKDSIQEAIRQIEIYLKKVGEASNVKVNTLAPGSEWNSNSGSNSPGNGPGTSSPGSDSTSNSGNGNKADTWWFDQTARIAYVGTGYGKDAQAFAQVSFDADTSTKEEWIRQYGNLFLNQTLTNLDSNAIYAKMKPGGEYFGLSYEKALEEEMKKYKGSKISKVLEFASGGYTGDWAGGDGRLAMLHSKEIVLNEADTANFLSAVSMIRQIASFGTSIQDNIMSGIDSFVNQFSGGVGSIKNGNNSSKQTIFNITAPITSTATTDEIQNAILQLPNLATQFASRNAF